MNNEARIAAQMQTTRGVLNQGRYHDVIIGMRALSMWERPEGKVLAFTAIDRLLDVDVKHYSKILLHNFYIIESVLHSSGLDVVGRMSRKDVVKKAQDALIHGHTYALLDALATLYKYDGGQLSTSNWENVYKNMPKLVTDNKEKIYPFLLHDGYKYERIIRKICNGDPNCVTCSKHNERARCVIT